MPKPIAKRHTYMNESCAEFERQLTPAQAYLKLMSKFELAKKTPV